MEDYKQLVLENFDLTKSTSFEDILVLTTQVESVVTYSDLALCLYFTN